MNPLKLFSILDVPPQEAAPLQQVLKNAGASEGLRMRVHEIQELNRLEQEDAISRFATSCVYIPTNEDD